MIGRIDINCDMAEGVGNERELMPWITSANIACGYHAGDPDLMKRTVDLCLEFNVAVGAHPSFPDRENFGRSDMTLPMAQLSDILTEQVLLLRDIARQQGAKLHHVKPHGALYNMAAKDTLLALCIGEAVKAVDNSLILFGSSGSAMVTEARRIHLKAANEVFADRSYQLDGTLTPRSQPGALIENEEDAVGQAIRLAKENKVKAVSGGDIHLEADTICLHGDGAHAVTFAKVIYDKLRSENITIQALR